jgi:hypothetical protein
MFVLLVPAGLLALVALLWLAESLERRTPALFVRFALRSRAPEEVTEQVVASELAAVLRVNGLDTPAPERVEVSV